MQAPREFFEVLNTKQLKELIKLYGLSDQINTKFKKPAIIEILLTEPTLNKNVIINFLKLDEEKINKKILTRAKKDKAKKNKINDSDGDKSPLVV